MFQGSSSALPRVSASHMVPTEMMDWGLCIVCQKKTSEALKCPLKADGSGDKSGAYVSFMANVNEFKRLKEMPVPLCLGEDVDVDEHGKGFIPWDWY